MSNARKSSVTSDASANPMERTDARDFTTTSDSYTTSKSSVAKDFSRTEQALPTQKFAMTTEGQTTTTTSAPVRGSSLSTLRDTTQTAKPYSSWNVKHDATLRSGGWIQVRMGDREELKRDMIPRAALLKRVPALHKYLDEDSGHVILPDSAVEDDALDTVIDAIIACVNSEYLEMTLPEDPLELIQIHCVLVLFELKKEASIVKERLWSTMGRYELKDSQVREIWYTFSDDENIMEAQYVAPDRAEYVQMMAWQLVNLEIEKNLNEFVLLCINNTPPLKQALLERYEKFGTAPGYDLVPGKPQPEKEDITASTLDATPRASASSQWTKFGNENIKAPLNESFESKISGSNYPPAADNVSLAKTGGKRGRSEEGFDSENEKEGKKTKIGFVSSGKNTGSIGNNMFGQTSSVKRSSTQDNAPEKKSAAGRKTAGQAINLFGGTLTPAVSTPGGGSKPATMPVDFGGAPGSVATSSSLSHSESSFGGLSSPKSNTLGLSSAATPQTEIFATTSASTRNNETVTPDAAGGGIFGFPSKMTTTAGTGTGSAQSEASAARPGSLASRNQPLFPNAFESPASGNPLGTSSTVAATPTGGYMFNIQNPTTTAAMTTPFGPPIGTNSSANPFQSAGNSIFGNMPIAPALQPLSDMFGGRQSSTAPNSGFVNSFGSTSNPQAQTSLQTTTTPNWNFNTMGDRGINQNTPSSGAGAPNWNFNAMGDGGNTQNTFSPGAGVDNNVFNFNSTASAQGGGMRRYATPKGRLGRQR